jgi:quercetin dioxygenase-like cupin family protein
LVRYNHDVAGPTLVLAVGRQIVRLNVAPMEDQEMSLAKSRFARRVSCVLLVLGVTAMVSKKQPEAKEGTNKPSEMTVTSFDQVEPQQFSWGWIRWLLNSEADPEAEMTLGMVYIKPGQENPRHLHPQSAEYLHVLEGSCDHLVGDQWATLKAGDTVRIPKNVPHRARTTNQACRVIVVYNTGKRQMVTLED